MTLTEFLLARIAEDETLWQMAADADLALVAGRRSMPAIPPEGFARRMLAECKAKRRLIVEVGNREDMGHEADVTVDHYRQGLVSMRDSNLRYLAAVYSDHPDYREEWRP